MRGRAIVLKWKGMKGFFSAKRPVGQGSVRLGWLVFSVLKWGRAL